MSSKKFSKQSTFIVLISFLSICCTNNPKIPVEKEHIARLSEKNDTFCLSTFPHSGEIQLIRACHIILSDSLSEELFRLFAKDLLPAKYNYDNFNGNLKLSDSGGYYELSKLYAVQNRNYRIVFDTVFFSKDTLFFGEKRIRVSDKSDFHGLKFEEVYYQFLIKSGKTPNVRDLFFARNYLYR